MVIHSIIEICWLPHKKIETLGSYILHQNMKALETILHSIETSVYRKMSDLFNDCVW